MIRVAIIAASPLARAGLAAMLPAPDYEIIASLANLDELEDSLDGAEADAVLFEAPEPWPLDSARRVRLRALARETPVIVLANERTPSSLPFALRTSAPSAQTENNATASLAAFLPKDISPQQLRAAINAVAAGLVVALPQLVPAYSALSSSRSTEAPDLSLLAELAEPLTPRERQVLQMLAGGLANKEIAAKLGISDHTAKFHVAAILGKLGAATRTEAVTIAIRHGLVLL